MQDNSIVEIKPSLSEGITLYQGLNYKAVIPNPPKISPDQGLHIQISGEHDQTDTPKQVLQRFLLVLGSAKAVAESGITPDFWANTRIENDQEVTVYGRVPGNESSWRKPVNPPQNPTSLEGFNSIYNSKKLERLFGKYLPLWEKLMKKIELFSQGINGQEVPISEENKDGIIWTNGKIQVKIMRHYPWQHIPGLHFIVSPSEKISRQWQTILESQEVVNNGTMIQELIQTNLECAAIAFAVRQLISQGRGEIHNSGNWAKGLKTTNEGGQLDDNKRDKREKKRHFTRIRLDSTGKKIVKKPEASFGTSMHVHVYIPENPNEPVVLPTMPFEEAKEKNISKQLEAWGKIRRLNEEEIRNVLSKINDGKLTNWIEKNCQGQLL